MQLENAQSDETVGIIGANGQVCREVTAILQEYVDVVALVRNQLGASFFEMHGYDYRIGELEDIPESNQLLSGLDTVVVAAHASTRGMTTPREARQTNEKLVKHAVEYSPADASIIYFSSISAHGSELYDARSKESGLNRYRLTKVRNERLLEQRAEERGKEWYALRLGHVFGVNQSRTRAIKRELNGVGRSLFRVEPDRPSNVVFNPTVADAILQCIAGTAHPGTYTVVNKPQWTWGDIVEYYATEESTYRFVPPREPTTSSPVSKLVSPVLSQILSYRDQLIPVLSYLPNGVNRRILNTYNIRSARSDIDAHISRRQERESYHLSIFDYNEAPGEYLPGLTDTRTLLEDIDLTDIFVKRSSFHP